MYGAPYGDDRPIERDLAGTPLAGGLFAVIYSLKGDLDYFAKCLKLRHYNRNEMCDFGCCTRVGVRGMLYNNFAPDCMWKTMGFDELTWRANYIGKFLHWLFNLPGVCHYMLEPDELHVIHLGCMQYCIGSVLWLLCYIIMLDEPESNMHACWLIICEYYRTFGSKCQYTNLGLESFLKDKKQPKKHYPCLKGKGAECRDLLPAVHSVWLQCAKRYHDYELIEAMLKSMVVVQDHLHDHASDMFLPLDVCRDIMKRVDNF